MSITKEQLDEYIKAYSQGHSLISDEEYDNLLEEYIKENGEENRPFLRVQQSSNVNDIVGTLPKVYGVEKPMREGQKTYVNWLTTKKINTKRHIIIQPKFDGCSVSLDNVSKKFYTRGDYDNGESVDVTELFQHNLKNMNFSENVSAVKFEAIIPREIFDSLNQNNSYKRPRDMASGIITSRDIILSQYIMLIPLREYKENEQYVSEELKNLSVIDATADDLDIIQGFIDNKLSDMALIDIDGYHFAIDGVVVSVMYDTHTIPSQEVAIKILNNIKETKIINIEYQYGRTGKITPVGILEPVKFDEITVDHVGLSNLDRVMALGLKYDDTVRVVYNIVPYLLDSYHDGRYPIPIPTKCPICGAEFNFKTLKTVRCTNPQCTALKIGMITRYCEKMKMMGLSKGTIVKLFEGGLIKNISDLYKLTPDDIMTLDGFKEKSSNNICNIIKRASTDVPLSRWLGALPIKDISSKTWQLIIDAQFPMDEMKASNTIRYHIENGSPMSFMEECIPKYVYGFSVNKYMMLKEGLTLYWDDIHEVIKYVTFKCTTDVNRSIKGRVTMTGTRDEKLTSYLKEKGYDVNDYSSKTIALIVPFEGYTSSKVVKAKKLGVPIYTIDQAYNAF